MKLVILGAGGHGRVCAEIAEATGRFNSIVFSDSTVPIGSQVHRWQVAYRDDDLDTIMDTDGPFECFVGIGQTRTGTARERLYTRLRNLGAKISVLVSRSAHIAESAQLGAGSLVSHHASVNTSARIGPNVIVNSHALIEHDCEIGAHVHVSTGAIVNGSCTIGARTFIGSNATVNQDITICSDAIVGSGAVIIGDIVAPGVYVGVPARRVPNADG